MKAKDHQTFVKIAVLENTIEAQLIDSVLNDQNIPHVMRSYHDTAYDGLFQALKGWGEVCAPASFKGAVIEILKNVRADKPPDHTM